jgi:hypothetical protein
MESSPSSNSALPRRRAVLMVPLVLAAMPCRPAVVAAPVEGTVTLNGQSLRVGHVAARRHDNAEGVIDQPLLLVFSEQAVPAAALDGGMALGVHRMARAGQLRGFMLRFDSAKPGEASLVLLDSPADARTGLAFVSIAATEPVIGSLRLTADRIEGRLDRPPQGEPPASIGYALRFDAPLSQEPAVTADLSGAPMKASAEFKLVAAYADAMARGDLAAVRGMSGAALREQTDGLVAAVGEVQAIARMKKGGISATSQLARFQRLVERGGRATLIVGRHEYVTLAKDGGEWRMGS